MKGHKGHLMLVVAAIGLGGCSLMVKLFPHRPTDAEARAAILRCGVSPDRIAWRVTEDGGLVFGEKTENGPALPSSLTPCLMSWGKWNRVNVGFLIWDERLKS
jgi:hypothetical protein